MAGITHIEIKQSAEELETLVRQQNNGRRKSSLTSALHDKNSRYERVCHR
jgi:hypothetical protein